MLKWHYSNIEHDDRGVWETRGFACEIVAVSITIAPYYLLHLRDDLKI